MRRLGVDHLGWRAINMSIAEEQTSSGLLPVMVVAAVVVVRVVVVVVGDDGGGNTLIIEMGGERLQAVGLRRRSGLGQSCSLSSEKQHASPVPVYIDRPVCLKIGLFRTMCLFKHW